QSRLLDYAIDFSDGLQCLSNASARAVDRLPRCVKLSAQIGKVWHLSAAATSGSNTSTRSVQGCGRLLMAQPHRGGNRTKEYQGWSNCSNAILVLVARSVRSSMPT